MKSLIDAQLPRRLADEIQKWGGDAIHTLDLPAGNATSDQVVTEVADREGRIVIAKDSDFVDSYLLSGVPGRLLLISTGNIPNAGLFLLLQTNWNMLLELFEEGSFVELSRTALTLHS